MQNHGLHQDLLLLQLAALWLTTLDEPKVLADAKVHRVAKGEEEDMVGARVLSGLFLSFFFGGVWVFGVFRAFGGFSVLGF